MVAKFKKIEKKSFPQPIVFLILFLILVLVGFFIFTNWRINQRRAELQSRIESLKKEIQILEKKNEELRVGIQKSSTESYLEKAAREEFNLKKPGEEVVVVLPPEDYNPPTTHTEESSWQKLGDLWQKILEKFRF